MTMENAGPIGDRLVSERDVFALMTEPFTLEPGHKLRRHRCIICAALIGGIPVRVLAAVCAYDTGCPCGELDTSTFLMCAGHGDGDLPAMASAALRFSLRAHPPEPQP